MEIVNQYLNNIHNGTTNLLQRYRDGKIDLNKLKEEVEQLRSESTLHKGQLEIDLDRIKRPLAGHYEKDYKAMGESQNQRAYLLLGQDIDVIQYEVAQGIRNKEFDFVFKMLDLVKHSGKSEIEKNRLNPHIEMALKESGADKVIYDLNQARVIHKNTESLVNHIGLEGEDYFKAVTRDREVNEIGYARENSSQGGYQVPKMD